MKRILISIIMVVVGLAAACANGFRDETLHYVVSYKWGLIHKDAGDATVTLRNSGDRYLLTLTGKTKPWADKIYEVRDTLRGVVLKDGFKALRYTKAAHEEGKFDLDDITYSYSGLVAGGKAVRTKINKKGEVKKSEKMLTATGPTYDLLSVFFYMRTLDYTHLEKGKVVNCTIFSGRQVEKLALRSLGKEMVKLKDGEKVEAYHIKFNFTSAGKKKSSDDIDAWLSTEPGHVPLLVVGSLPIGQIKCYLVR